MNKIQKGLIALAAVVGLSGGAVAVAAIPSSNGTIYGCYNNYGGALRVIDSPSQTCASAYETAINWKQNGSAPAPGTLSGLHTETRVFVATHPTPYAVHTENCPAGEVLTGAAGKMDYPAYGIVNAISAPFELTATGASFNAGNTITGGPTGDATYTWTLNCAKQQ